MNYEIGNPQLGWLLLAVPVVAVSYLYSRQANRNAKRKFGATNGPSRWLSSLLSVALLTSGVALLALACMDIRWGKTTREVPQRGLEVVFALDVSRSMLAQDAKPNRLTRAKQQIKDMLAEMAGDRVGLVVFAGEANQAVPLTNHYHDFQQKLDSVGPESVPVGGSQLGVAIKAASEAFLSKTNDHKTVVLFTDGEDQESKPIELAKKLHTDNGLRIFTVGLGDMTEGARIPNDNGSRQTQGGQFVQHNGQQVWSKLDGRILKQIATETDGAYIPAGTKRVNMGDVYHRYIASVEKAEFETAKINAYIPRFQWFALPALLCILLHTWIETSSRTAAQSKRKSKVTSQARSVSAHSKTSKTGKAAAILLLIPGLAFGQDGTDDSVAARINKANELLRNQKTSAAIDAYSSIEDASSAETQDTLQYNLASAHYRNSDIEAAEKLFASTTSSNDKRIARDSRYNLGNCHYAKALPLVEQQPDAAISELEKAIQQYRNALRLDRTFADARENLERARKLIEKLKGEQQEQQQQNEEQKSQQDQQKNQDQQSQNDPENKQSSDEQSQDEKNQEQQSSDQSNQQQDGQKGDQSDSSQQDQQQQGSSESEEQSNQQPQAGEGSEQQANQTEGSQDSKTNSQQSANQQQSQDRNQANDNQQDPNGESAAESQEGKQPPKGQLSADNAPESNAQSDKDAAQAMLARQSEADNGMMTRQEALKLLQSVRDRDMLRRFRKKQRQRQNRVQVEKDW